MKSRQSIFSNRKVFRLAFGDHSEVMWVWPPHAWDILFEYFTIEGSNTTEAHHG